MSELSIENISKTFAGHRALDEISLAFSTKKITAIIGRSGCGKSTLLKILNGLERPDQGIVKVFSVPIDYSSLPELRKKIGYAVQGIGLFPHLSVKKNITLLAELSGWRADDIEQRLQQLLKLMQLEYSQLNRYPHELSGGQQQRVGLCRAMILNPPVLLLDEAFAALDPLTRSDIHQQLLVLQQAEPRTTLLVTHDMQEALTLADDIVIMEKGRVVVHRSSEALLAESTARDPNALLLSLMSSEDCNDEC